MSSSDLTILPEWTNHGKSNSKRSNEITVFLSCFKLFMNNLSTFASSGKHHRITETPLTLTQTR